MYKEGHVGAALLAYAPLGALAVAVGDPALARAGAVTAAGLAMLPDVDMRLPFLKHRGPTHTVWFAVACGLVSGVLGGYTALAGGVRAALATGAFTAVVATLTVLSHVLADALTPMGVRPFTPWSNRWYSLHVTRASDPRSNRLLLVAGVAAASATVTGDDWLHALPV